VGGGSARAAPLSSSCRRGGRLGWSRCFAGALLVGAGVLVASRTPSPSDTAADALATEESFFLQRSRGPSRTVSDTPAGPARMQRTGVRNRDRHVAPMLAEEVPRVPLRPQSAAAHHLNGPPYSTAHTWGPSAVAGMAVRRLRGEPIGSGGWGSTRSTLRSRAIASTGYLAEPADLARYLALVVNELLTGRCDFAGQHGSATVRQRPTRPTRRDRSSTLAGRTTRGHGCPSVHRAVLASSSCENSTPRYPCPATAPGLPR